MLRVFGADPVQPHTPAGVLSVVLHIEAVRTVVGPESGMMRMEVDFAECPCSPSAALQGLHERGERWVESVAVLEQPVLARGKAGSERGSRRTTDRVAGVASVKRRSHATQAAHIGHIHDTFGGSLLDPYRTALIEHEEDDVLFRIPYTAGCVSLHDRSPCTHWWRSSLIASRPSSSVR